MPHVISTSPIPHPHQAATGNADVHLHVVDLSSLQQIQRFSADFARSGKPLHVLVNNAATMQDSRGVTAEGVETAQATNLLGFYGLTQGLLPVLKANAPARIVNVVSAGMLACVSFLFFWMGGVDWGESKKRRHRQTHCGSIPTRNFEILMTTTEVQAQAADGRGEHRALRRRGAYTRARSPKFATPQNHITHHRGGKTSQPQQSHTYIYTGRLLPAPPRARHADGALGPAAGGRPGRRQLGAPRMGRHPPAALRGAHAGLLQVRACLCACVVVCLYGGGLVILSLTLHCTPHHNQPTNHPTSSG